MDGKQAFDDPRFAAMHKSGTFQRRKKTSQGLSETDERFKASTSDPRFASVDSAVDKYGRKKGQKSKSKLSKDDRFDTKTIKDDDQNQSQTNDDSHREKMKSMNMDTRIEYLNKLARGEISDESDESSNEVESDASSESSDDEDSVDISKKDGNSKSLISKYYHSYEDEIDNDADNEHESSDAPSTSRLAIQNCDWDNLRASDILVVLQSFLPIGGKVERVTVYPSDFGKERMAIEQKHGPQGIWDDRAEENDEDDVSDPGVDLYDTETQSIDAGNDISKKGSGDFKRRGRVGLVIQNDSDDSDEENEKVKGINTVKLREYELSKLRYYFAIAEFDSIATAEAIYKELDGVELEHSSMVFDLRFVPDDIDFSGRDIRDSVNELPGTYQPPQFIVNALQHTNVSCTWDSGERERESKLTNISAWKQLEVSDLQQYVASSEESEEENDFAKKKRAANMRKLLLGGDAEEEDEAPEDEFFVKDDEDQDQVYTYIPELGSSIIDKKKAEKETVFEATMRKMEEKKTKRKERRKEQQDDDQLVHGFSNQKPYPKANDREETSVEQLELLMDDANSSRDYDMRQIIKDAKSKGKKKKTKKNGGKNNAETEDSFRIDVEDTRFKNLFEGNSKFGIDRTANEFKETPAMKTILEQQRKKRKLHDSEPVETERQKSDSIESETQGTTDMKKLVNHIRKKFAKSS